MRNCPVFFYKSPSLWNASHPAISISIATCPSRRSHSARSQRPIVDQPSFGTAKLNPSPDTDQILGNSHQTHHQTHGQICRGPPLRCYPDHGRGFHRYHATGNTEISRLQNLARLNSGVDKQEIKNLQTHQTSLEEALAETRFRLDSFTSWWLRIEEVSFHDLNLGALLKFSLSKFSSGFVI